MIARVRWRCERDSRGCERDNRGGGEHMVAEVKERVCSEHQKGWYGEVKGVKDSNRGGRFKRDAHHGVNMTRGE